MFKSEEQKKLEALAQKFSKKDKRLSWQSCMKKAKEQNRLFNQI